MMAKKWGKGKNVRSGSVGNVGIDAGVSKIKKKIAEGGKGA